MSRHWVVMSEVEEDCVYMWVIYCIKITEKCTKQNVTRKEVQRESETCRNE